MPKVKEVSGCQNIVIAQLAKTVELALREPNTRVEGKSTSVFLHLTAIRALFFFSFLHRGIGQSSAISSMLLCL